MEAIRDFLKSWPGRIFLMFCLSPLALLGLESYFRGGANADAVATVGETPITRAELQRAVTERRNELLNTGIDASQINDQALRSEVLEGLIDRILLKEQIKFLGMHTPDVVINNQLLEEPQFQDESGSFSNDRFAYALKQQGITKEQLFSEYRQQMGLMQLYDSVTQTAIYPKAQVAQFLAEQQQSKPVWIYRLPWQDFSQQVTVSNADIQAYYDEHRDELTSEAMLDLNYLSLSAKDVPEEVIKIENEELDAAYQNYVSREMEQSRKRVSQILITDSDPTTKLAKIESELKKGTDFSKLVAEYSEDPNASADGDIGTFNPDLFGEDAAKVSSAIANVEKGEVSEPVQTQFGYHVFKVTETEGANVASLEEMSERLKQQIRERKQANWLAEKITQINEMATDGVSVVEIAQQMNLSAHRVKDYKKVGPNDLLNQPAVRTAVFDEFSIQDGSVSTSIELGGEDNTTVWVQSSNYRPVTQLGIQQATPTIRKLLLKEKAIQLAVDEAKKLAQTVSEKDMSSVAVSFTNLGEVNRLTDSLNTFEKTTAFSEHHSQDKPVAKAVQTQEGATVMVLGAVKTLDAKDVPDFEVEQAVSFLSQNLGQQEFADYLEFLKLLHPVSINEEALADLNSL